MGCLGGVKLIYTKWSVNSIDWYHLLNLGSLSIISTGRLCEFNFGKNGMKVKNINVANVASRKHSLCVFSTWIILWETITILL